jgi:ankyrin repeat protein
LFCSLIGSVQAYLLLRAGADVNAHNEARISDTALKLAAEQADSAMVTLLLDAGADPLIPGWMGLTPWDKAQDRRSAEGLKVRALMEKAVSMRMRQETKTRKRTR